MSGRLWDRVFAAAHVAFVCYFSGTASPDRSSIEKNEEWECLPVTRRARRVRPPESPYRRALALGVFLTILLSLLTSACGAPRVTPSLAQGGQPEPVAPAPPAPPGPAAPPAAKPDDLVTRYAEDDPLAKVKAAVSRYMAESNRADEILRIIEVNEDYYLAELRPREDEFFYLYVDKEGKEARPAVSHADRPVFRKCENGEAWFECSWRADNYTVFPYYDVTQPDPIRQGETDYGMLQERKVPLFKPVGSDSYEVSHAGLAYAVRDVEVSSDGIFMQVDVIGPGKGGIMAGGARPPKAYITESEQTVTFRFQEISLPEPLKERILSHESPCAKVTGVETQGDFTDVVVKVTGDYSFFITGSIPGKTISEHSAPHGSCAINILFRPSPGDSSVGSSEPGQAPVSLAEPFVFWDRGTTIPFIYSASGGSSNSDATSEPASVFFLGLWDLEKGTVSFVESPLFSLSGPTNRVYWDGGDRFAFAGGTLAQLDPRIGIENVDVPTSDSWAGPGYLLAAPSGSDALFITYMDSENKPVLEIRNHPLAGRIVMDLPELAPETSVLGPVGIEVGQDEVRLYFETSRTDKDLDSGAVTYVQGILRARYYLAATTGHVQWRMVNPEVPAFVAGGGTRFSQFRGEIVMSTQGRRPEVLDLVTGDLSAPPEFEEELAKADPGFVNGDGADLCYGYGEYRIVNVNYFRDAAAEQVSHIFAFSGDRLVGRIECVNDRVSVFKDGVKTFETTRPLSGSGVFQFPHDVQPPSNSEPGGKTYGPAQFDAIWKPARYADLFNETLRSDGWMAEQAAVVLMERFSADPTGFVRALAVAPGKEVEIVGDLLAYNADYRDLNAYRQQVEDLKKDFSSGKELDVLDKLLDRITQFEIRMGRRPS